MINWQQLSQYLEKTIGQAFPIDEARAVHGGDINSAYRLRSVGKTYFIKLNRAGLETMFAAEAAGLQEMAKTCTVRVPEVIVWGTVADSAFLLLEAIDFGRSSPVAERLLGQNLACMHRIRQPFFGWHQDNTIGSTPQPNARSANWPQFWQQQRLGFQLRLAATNGYGGRLQKKGEKLCQQMAALFADYQPAPSLLHGDLWGGNAAVDSNGEPVIFDPACYYGDREADLAMTELFGGFGRDFYAAYREEWPLDAGYPVRKVFYNLYHILNHLNLFGSGYLSQAEAMIDRMLSELAF